MLSYAIGIANVHLVAANELMQVKKINKNVSYFITAMQLLN